MQEIKQAICFKNELSWAELCPYWVLCYFINVAIMCLVQHLSFSFINILSLQNLVFASNEDTVGKSTAQRSINGAIKMIEADNVNI